MSNSIPTLETERLILRPFALSDCEALAEIHGSDEVARFVMPEGKPQPTPAQAYAYILSTQGHWLIHGIGKWAVVEKASGLVAGRCGYNDFAYDWPGLELGWTMHPRVWGRGYATEAARAARDWAYRVRGVPSMLHAIEETNTASQAVARRIGAAPAELWTGRGMTLRLWRQTRPV